MRAWENESTPYFLCLDEMNLAPVEQYFAEYLSVVESRKRNETGKVVTDPILKPEFEKKGMVNMQNSFLRLGIKTDR